MLFFLITSLALNCPGSWAPPQSEDIAFTHVRVLSMIGEGALTDHTVLIRNGRIAAMGPTAEVELPEGTHVIQGEGRTLMPGLVDMHVHNWLESEHALFLANGVTSVRNMFGSPLQLTWRAEINAGKRLGPNIYTSGPIVDGQPSVWPGGRVATTWEEGEQAVAEQVQAGYDFIKVYSRLPRDAYDGIIAAAYEAGVPVMGHVPAMVGIETVFASGQVTIEHLDGYEYLLAQDGLEARKPAAYGELWASMDSAKLTDVVEQTLAAGVWNCPTLIVHQKMVAATEIQAQLELSIMRYVPAPMLELWSGMAAQRTGMAEAIRAGEAARMQLTRALWKAGAGIILGTDQGNPFVVAGFSVHEELANLVAAGLTPYAALMAATRNAAECLGKQDEFGSIAVGLRADLLLLKADPLRDVANAKRRVGVMLRGRWLDEASLQSMLAELID